MRPLAGHEGSWSGVNAFRLMPGDPTRDGPMTATVSRAAQGGLTQVAYGWVHPDDGEQEGLLVLGPGAGSGDVAAFWGDSWHQRPEPRTLVGTLAGAVATVVYAYAGDWRWEIVVDASAADGLTLTMNNVVPDSAATDDRTAGPYRAMHAELRRDG